MIAALAFACTILLEPAADVRCHRTVEPGVLQVSAPAASGTDDACGSTCVPDCYCCSTPLAASVSIDSPSTVLAALGEPRPPRSLDGVLAVPHLPPIA